MIRIGLISILLVIGGCSGLGSKEAVNNKASTQNSNQFAFSINDFARNAEFKTVKISPTGEYLAADKLQDDRSALVIIRRSDNAITSSFGFGKDEYLKEFFWANEERVVATVSQQRGKFNTSLRLGEIYAINADGKNPKVLYGPNAGVFQTGTRLQRIKPEAARGEILNVLPNDKRHIIIASYPIDYNIQSQLMNEIGGVGESPLGRSSIKAKIPAVYRLDIYNGNRSLMIRAPMEKADFILDARGRPRFAYGLVEEGLLFLTNETFKVYYSDDTLTDWREIDTLNGLNGEDKPVGILNERNTFHFLSNRDANTVGLYQYNLDAGEIKLVFRDEQVDIEADNLIWSNDGQRLLAIEYIPDTPRYFYIDKDFESLHQGLLAAFPNSKIRVTSQSENQVLSVVEVTSDRNSGEYYVFDSNKKNVDYILSRHEWLNPDKLAKMQPFQTKARDGLALNGYITLPNGSAEKPHPLVVFINSSPKIGRESWGYDEDVQLLASRGYAVLQVSARGSEGYGTAFKLAGLEQWGRSMQDDITDATEWAIEQGHADANRICIYGASYGAYSAMMGAIRQPNLYKCAIGYVGVYDLNVMYKDTIENESSLDDSHWPKILGANEQLLEQVSPVNQAANLKVPVLLAHAGDDNIAPVSHARKMRSAMDDNDVSYETFFEGSEGHGFSQKETRAEYYQKLLNFIARYIGQ